MAYFEWSDELSVNIKKIDEQHHRLVEMINELYEGMKSKQANDILSKILTGMVEYAKTHFATEETYMATYKFPGLAEHKAEHAIFSAKAVDMLARYKINPAYLTAETGLFLKRWLSDHIQGTDKLYAPFLNDKGIY